MRDRTPVYSPSISVTAVLFLWSSGMTLARDRTDILGELATFTGGGHQRSYMSVGLVRPMLKFIIYNLPQEIMFLCPQLGKVTERLLAIKSEYQSYTVLYYNESHVYLEVVNYTDQCSYQGAFTSFVT